MFRVGSVVQERRSSDNRPPTGKAPLIHRKEVASRDPPSRAAERGTSAGVNNGQMRRVVATFQVERYPACCWPN
jgi:hypothetical protein